MTEALATITELTTTALGIITGNPVLMVCFVGSVVGIGFRVISQARNAVAQCCVSLKKHT